MTTPYPESTRRRAEKIIAEGLPIGPYLDPCVCGAGRHAHRGTGKRPAPNATGSCPATGCPRYRPDLAYQLAIRALEADATTLGHSLREADRVARAEHYKDNPRKPGEWSIGASDTTTCPRKIQYRNRPPEGFVPDPEDNREARMGTMIHDAVTEKMRAMYPWRLYGLKVKIAGLDRESELDWFDPITGTLDDLKTSGDYKWDKWRDGPSDDEWGQVALYGLALEDMGYTVRTLRLLLLHRAKGHDEPHTRPYERAFAEKYRDLLLGYATALDLGVDLPKTEPGPSHSELCRRCFARSDCWNLVQAKDAGRSPESYTILGPDPVDPTIQWAIEEKLRLAQERLDAENAEKQAKVLLDGLTPGRYGNVELKEQWGGGDIDHAKWAERLAHEYPLPDDQRTPLEEIAVPQRARYSYLKPQRVRKAILDKETRDAAAAAKKETT